MCLVTKQKNAKRAKKNIACYKMLRQHVSDKGIEYLSPIYYHVWFVNKPDGSIHLASSPYWVKDEDKKPTVAGYEVMSGYFHTYKSKEDAVAAVNSNWVDGKCVVVKCVIPKGTRYYEGDFGFCESYASEFLKITKIIMKV